MKASLTLPIMVLAFFLLKETICSLVSIEYSEDSSCGDSSYLFGMQVSTSQCFRQVGAQGTGSAIVLCTSSGGSGLSVNEYAGSLDCSTTVTSTVSIQTSVISNDCVSSTISTNPYFPIAASGGSIKINCDADTDWYTEDDGRYELSRQTTSLESQSALDYTLDNCLENSIVTDMDYCYINQPGTMCVPTNTNPDDDSFCSNQALTTYAYSDKCIYDSYNFYYVSYWSDNSNSGYFQRNCNSHDEQYSLVVPYSDCVGCSRFKDLKDDSPDLAAIVGIIVGVSIAICCLCCLCGLAIAMCFCGSAAVCGMCVRGNKNKDKASSASASQHGTEVSVAVAAPMHYQQHQQGQQHQHQQQGHGQYYPGDASQQQSAPPMYEQYPQQQQQNQQYPQQYQQQHYSQQQQQQQNPHYQHQQSVELLQIRVPDGATPGMAMTVTKSTGEQVINNTYNN
jgi:hypothetical protein